MREIHEVIVHCASTRPNWMAENTGEERVSEIRRWHVEDNRWSDIGYHYVIDRDGKTYPGRPITRIGAHVKGHNKGTIGVCLIGGHGAAATDSFADHFTDVQARSLRGLIAGLSETYRIERISGHNEYSNKGCPGFYVPDWLGEVQEEPPKPSFVKRLLSKWRR